MNPTTPAATDLTALAQHLQTLGIPEIKAVDISHHHAESTLPIAFVPKGREVVDLTTLLDKHLPRPKQLVEAAAIFDTTSLIAYVMRNKMQETVLFADGNPDQPWIKAVIDYHLSSIDKYGEPIPSFCTHTATYSFPLSDEMKAWREKANGDLMSMEEFAWLLEEREHDIANPPVNWAMVPEAEVDNLCRILALRDDFVPGHEPSKEDLELPAGYRTKLQKLQDIRFGTQQQLLTLSREMSVRTDSRTAQKIDLQGGARVLVFEEDHQTEVKGTRVKVPEMFLIDIAIFDGEDRRLMPVRLYYRKAGGGLKWALKLVDPRRMIRDAVADAAKRVAQATDCPLFFGNPKPR
jgi:hypothetical protein